MITILDLKAEFDKLRLLRGRIPQMTGGISLMTATPKPTEHLTVDVEDPRTLTAAQLSNTIEEKRR